MTALEKADAEVSRLKEWTDVFKRVADDKAQQAAQELQASKARAAERQVAAAGGYHKMACFVCAITSHLRGQPGCSSTRKPGHHTCLDKPVAGCLSGLHVSPRLHNIMQPVHAKLQRGCSSCLHTQLPPCLLPTSQGFHSMSKQGAAFTRMT
jgi:hypothetical protein